MSDYAIAIPKPGGFYYTEYQDLYLADANKNGKLSAKEMLLLTPAKFQKVAQRTNQSDLVNILIEMAKSDPDKTFLLIKSNEDSVKSALGYFAVSNKPQPTEKDYQKVAGFFEFLSRRPGGFDIVKMTISDALSSTINDEQLSKRAKTRLSLVFMDLSPETLSRLESASRSRFAGLTHEAWQELMIPTLLFNNDKAQKLADSSPKVIFIDKPPSCSNQSQKDYVLYLLRDLHSSGYTPQAYQEFRESLHAAGIRNYTIPTANDGRPFIFTIESEHATITSMGESEAWYKNHQCRQEK
ncbi:MAG: hypothetical protein ABIH50_04450 [bacterium]